MRITTSLRTHPAVLAMPFIGIFFFYIFFTSTRNIEQLIPLPWPAQAASYALHAPVPMAAAAAAGLSAMDATRLRTLGTWDLGSAKPTWRIMLQSTLITVVSLTIPIAGVTAGGLGVVGALPDFYVLQLLCIVVFLLASHAVIGFLIGRRLHALYSAPLTAVAVFVGISFPLGTDSYWAHHVTGSIDWVGFGEAYSPAMTVAALLPTACVVLACVALTAPPRISIRSAFLSAVVAAGGVLVAYSITMDWRATPPTAKGLAPVTCTGSAPRLCLPEVGSEHIHEVQASLSDMVDRLAAKGIISQKPDRVTDISVADVRQMDADGSEWTLPLAPGDADQVLRENIAMAIVGIPCEKPNWNILHYNTLWTAQTIGTENAYLAWLSRETNGFRMGQTREQLLSETARVNKLPLHDQRAWHRQNLESACDEAEN
jgi:hypothetical protein